MIKKIKLFTNDKPKTIDAVNFIKKKLIENGFELSNNKYDLAIAIGGDGTFLKMLHDNRFNDNIYYVGINLGTLGFSQDINIDQLDNFIEEIKNNKFNIEEICIGKTILSTNNKNYNLYYMNEIVIRNASLRTIRFDININSNFFERYVGDALLISTPFGSTAENLSYNGSIIYNSLPSLQITPIGPINSSKYKTLRNSIIIPACYEIELNIEDNNLFIITDGKEKKYKNVNKIITKVNEKKIKLLRLNSYAFESKIYDKMLN